MVTQDELQAANENARELKARTPVALSAKYDRHVQRVVVELSSRLGLFFSPQDAEGLQGATPDQLEKIEISPSGYGLYFPKLDADIYIPALLEGVFGSERWLAGRVIGSEKDVEVKSMPIEQSAPGIKEAREG